ncbi:MAG: sulfatase-like hydrolase/transferase [Planctomycetaceae bacterium]
MASHSSSDISESPLGGESSTAVDTNLAAVRSLHWGWDALHLFSLSALTITQPLLDRLQRHPGYLAQEGLGLVDLVWVVALLLCGPPAVLLAVESLARIGGRSARAMAHQLCIAALLTWLLVSMLKEPLDPLRQHGFPSGLLTVSLSVAITWCLMRSYRRGGWVASLLSLSAIGVVVFPAMFFHSPRISAICFPEPPAQQPAQAGRPTPIVMVVFDGLCSTALLDESRMIDAVRYPSFAELASRSHWYRNTTTVHYRTDRALPSILTGQFPRASVAPFISEYPTNLFQLLRDSGQYEMTVFEPFTRLCPPSLRAVPIPRSTFERVSRVLSTMTDVHLSTSLPHDLGLPLPGIPRPWLRMPDTDAGFGNVVVGSINYGWDAERHGQVAHFLKTLRRADRPSLRFLHLVLPHYPWIYLPSGNRYAESSPFTDFPLGTRGVVGEEWGPDELATTVAWQRHLLQLQYCDRVVGDIMHRLDAEGLWDESLVIVTADHGVAFKAGKSRRDPTPQTLPSIMPVPLFIKLPGQTRPELSDRNVEIIDILPTIADVVDLTLPHATDGASLLDPREAPRPRKTLLMPQGEIAVNPDFGERWSYLDEMIRQFGTGAQSDRLLESPLHPEWVGKPITDFATDATGRLQIELSFGGSEASTGETAVIPCYFQGRVLNPDRIKLPVTLAVCVNGVVAGVTRTLNDDLFLADWCVLTDESLFHLGTNDVQVFEVIESGQDVEFRRCLVTGMRTMQQRVPSANAEDAID